MRYIGMPWTHCAEGITANEEKQSMPSNQKGRVAMVQAALTEWQRRSGESVTD